MGRNQGGSNGGPTDGRNERRAALQGRRVARVAAAPVPGALCVPEEGQRNGSRLRRRRRLRHSVLNVINWMASD